MDARCRVLVLSRRDHAEALAVREHLPSAGTVFVDDEGLRRGERLDWDLRDPADPLLSWGDDTFPVRDIRAVLYRPGMRRTPDGRIAESLLSPPKALGAEYAAFGRAEAESQLMGALLGADARWINPPAAETRAGHKLLQLALAPAAGLTVPPTLVSSDPERLRAFWAEQDGRVVAKAVADRPALTLGVPLPTRRVREGDLPALVAGPRVPTLFQRLVPARLDLRVTLIGGHAFGTAIHSQEGASPLDWRLDQSVRFTPYEVPPDILTALHTLRERLGLVYAAADLRLTPQGEHVFLEMNPQGSFLFVEQLTGAPIARTLARALLA
ncbi:hypothetical protein [Streptomyces geranii]|uniref:hypothetical protein n=1 Tax=Streptomyces geranii TaxID=2058923 RepID=UPI001300BBDD|nr:hypothetical protein [Streptomyces geranii]